MSLMREIYIKDILNTKEEAKSFVVFEEQIDCDLLLEKITQEQKRKGAEEMSKLYLDPVLMLNNYLGNKWKNCKALTKKEAEQKKIEFSRFKKLLKKINEEFSLTKYKESDYEPKITGKQNGWLVTNGKNYQTYFTNDDRIERELPQIDIIKNPTKKQLGSFDFGFKNKAGENKKNIEEFTYRHELGHIYDCLKRYVETGELSLLDTKQAVEDGNIKQLADSEGKANAYALDGLDRFTRRELLKNSSINRRTLDRDKTALEIDNAIKSNPESSNGKKQRIKKATQIYRAGTEKHSKTINKTLNSIEKEKRNLKEEVNYFDY